MHGAEPPGIVRQRGTGGGNRRLRLADMHHTLGKDEVRAEFIGRPEQNRIPVLRLSCNQCLRMLGTIEQRVRAEIFGDVVGDLAGAIRNAIDDAVGEPRQRHGRGIDGLGLRPPLGGDALGDVLRRGHQSPPGRGLDRAAVQRHGKATFRRRHFGLGVEALAQRRPRRLARRLVGIERRLACHFIEQFTHDQISPACWWSNS
jgi:hypothetical protein